MKIIALTDLHGKTSVITMLAQHIQSAQLVLLCGDITHFGHEREIISIIGQLRKINPNLYGVIGNCDYTDVEKYLVSENMSLNAAIREFEGYCLFGLSGSLPCPGKTPNEYDEEEYKAMLGSINKLVERPLIMVSHQPPFNTLNDQVSPDFHVGSRSIRQFIEKQQPLICFTGHIHEGIAIDYIGKTAIVNPGPAGVGNYALAEVEEEAIKDIQLCNIFA